MSEFEEDIEEEHRQSSDLPSVHHVEPKLFIGIVTLVLLGVYVVVLTLTEMRKADTERLLPIFSVPPVVVNPVPAEVSRVELAQAQPPRFTSDFAPAASTPLIESYEISYAHGVQSTVVYATVLPVQSVLVDFKARLEASQYVIVKMYESNTVSAIYAMKEEEELNITIASTVSEANLAPITQVTISHFDK